LACVLHSAAYSKTKTPTTTHHHQQQQQQQSSQQQQQQQQRRRQLPASKPILQASSGRLFKSGLNGQTGQG
jgi:hypothetical protein